MIWSEEMMGRVLRVLIFLFVFLCLKKEFTNMVMSIHFIIVNLEILLFSYLTTTHFVLHELLYSSLYGTWMYNTLDLPLTLIQNYLNLEMLFLWFILCHANVIVICTSLVPSSVQISLILIITLFSRSHEQNICSFHESRPGKALINILINISNVCAIFLNLLIFPLKEFFLQNTFFNPCEARVCN
jgi:hypothetical protein